MLLLTRLRLTRLRRLGLPIAAVAVLGVSLTTAQTSRVAGALQGNIVDQTGSAIAGAKITLRNQRTNQIRTILSNTEGFFYLGELPVGSYALRIESPGFASHVNDAIVISIGRVTQLTVRLAPGRV